jgi:hypothetical protein
VVTLKYWPKEDMMGGLVEEEESESMRGGGEKRIKS